MTLADEDTNSTLTDNVNRAIQGNVAMQVTQSGSKVWNQAMQVMPADDQILNQFATNEKISCFRRAFNESHGFYTL